VSYPPAAATLLARISPPPVEPWRLSLVATTAAVVAGLWYVGAVHRRRSPWPPLRTASFLGGLALVVLVTGSSADAWARGEYWVWVSQALVLLLIAPLPLMCGQPLELAGRLHRPRVLRSPLLGPALLPVVCVLALFGSAPGWSVADPAVGWLTRLLLLVAGCVMVLPLVSATDQPGSLAIGIAVAFVELLVDAVPGIVLRLSTHPVSTFFTHRPGAPWALPWLADQQRAGGILWVVAELVDLPFLILIFRRWVRADAREARLIDAALDASDGDGTGGDADQPWFLADPRWRER
jgi:putative membrane protein